MMCSHPSGDVRDRPWDKEAVTTNGHFGAHDPDQSPLNRPSVCPIDLEYFRLRFKDQKRWLLIDATAFGVNLTRQYGGILQRTGHDPYFGDSSHSLGLASLAKMCQVRA